VVMNVAFLSPSVMAGAWGRIPVAAFHWPVTY
jgi:hypothetical protein